MKLGKTFTKIFLIALLLSSAVMVIGNENRMKYLSQNDEVFPTLAISPTNNPIPSPSETPTIVYYPPTYTPTPSTPPDPTANWTTYTNNYFKLSFKYPSDWKLVKTDHNVMRLNNSKNNVYLIIADSRNGGWEYPYPSEQSGWGFKDYYITIDGKDIILAKSYIVDKDAFVTSNVGKVNSSRDIFLTFGTGSPGFPRDTASQADLDSEWETIISILTSIDAGPPEN